MTLDDIIRMARAAGVPDTSSAPAGALAPWVVDFARRIERQVKNENR